MNIYTIKVDEIDDTFEVCADEVKFEGGKLSLFFNDSKDVSVFNSNGELVNTMQRVDKTLCGEFNNVEYFYIEADDNTDRVGTPTILLNGILK